MVCHGCPGGLRRVALVRGANLSKAMSDPKFVFVYGSLMRGLELHHYMSAGSFVTAASTNGVLVSLGRYPGLIEGTGTVQGELYEFDDLAAALDVLDDLEEFDATDPAASLYVRVPRQVTREDGRAVTAWTYLYNRKTPDAPNVESGDWRATTLR